MALQQSTTTELWEVNILKYLKTIFEGRETTTHRVTVYTLHTHRLSMRTIFKLAPEYGIPPTVCYHAVRGYGSLNSRFLQNTFVRLYLFVWSPNTCIFQQKRKKLLLLASSLTLHFIFHIWNKSVSFQGHKRICADTFLLEKAAYPICLMTFWASNTTVIITRKNFKIIRWLYTYAHIHICDLHKVWDTILVVKYFIKLLNNCVKPMIPQNHIWGLEEGFIATGILFWYY